MMLECIGEKYKLLLGRNEGPRLTIVEDGRTKKINVLKADLEQYEEAYWNHINSDISQTLKKDGGSGETYSVEQKELMLWYNYFFLNRGKPTTHISVLSKMSDIELKNKTPDVIKKIIEEAKTILSV
jgi:hypothetical protein